MSSRSLLFVAYNFPPHGGPGVQRSLKFVKYLPEFGWQPVVISAAPEASPLQDASLAAEIPRDAAIHRLPGFSILRLLAQAKRYRLGKAVVLLNLLLQVPDPAIFWALRARATVARLIQAQRPAAIYTTSGPYSAHLVGLWARQQFGIPWLADFRDPWSRNLLIPYLPGYRALNRRIERRVLRAADAITCVSQPWLEDLQANLGERAEKFFFLPNGYDEADIQPLPAPQPGAPFTITHLGSFYRNRKPQAFLQAIDALMRGGQIPPASLRLRFIGKNPPGALPSQPPFEIYGYLPHSELGRFRAESDVFLLILGSAPENRGNYSGKIYEYLACNRPLLGIVPRGGVAEQLIAETRTGIAVSDSPAEIGAAILRLYQEWRAGNPGWNPDWQAIRQYTRRNQTARLAEILNALTSKIPETPR